MAESIQEITRLCDSYEVHGGRQNKYMAQYRKLNLLPLKQKYMKDFEPGNYDYICYIRCLSDKEFLEDLRYTKFGLYNRIMQKIDPNRPIKKRYYLTKNHEKN